MTACTAAMASGCERADREDAVATEEVQIADSLGVDQVRSLAAGPGAVEAEGPEDPAHLRIQVAIVELHLLACPRGEEAAHGWEIRDRHGLSVAGPRCGTISRAP